MTLAFTRFEKKIHVARDSNPRHRHPLTPWESIRCSLHPATWVQARAAALEGERGRILQGGGAALSREYRAMCWQADARVEVQRGGGASGSAKGAERRGEARRKGLTVWRAWHTAGDQSFISFN